MEELVFDTLKEDFHLDILEISKLSLGADLAASTYKATASNNKSYFIKCQKGGFEFALNFLKDADVHHLLFPEFSTTIQGGEYSLFVYPYVEGENGFTRKLSEKQWKELGKTLNIIHTLHLSQDFIPREKFSGDSQEFVRSVLTQGELPPIKHNMSKLFYNFLRENKALIVRLLNRAEVLTRESRLTNAPFVLCHSDIHAGNVLLGDDEIFYIVDWDNLILAPKERDLMFIGGGVGNVWNDPKEQDFFYNGYGKVEIDKTLLSYYRFTRIVEDIAEYCQLFLSPDESIGLETMYQHFLDQFAPKGVVEIAFENDV